APALLKARGVNDRVTIEAGDFFKSVPAGGDAYMLSHIIHDWDEDQCLTILGHIRKAMNSGGRLLIAEMVLPAGDAPHPGKMLDIAMLVWPGGQERTLTEYDHLLSKPASTLPVWYRPNQRSTLWKPSWLVRIEAEGLCGHDNDQLEPE